jgi:cell division protein FtsB
MEGRIGDHKAVPAPGRRKFPRGQTLFKKPRPVTVNDQVRLVKYLLALWVSVAVYAGMSLLAGGQGILAYNGLLAEQKKQEENMETLRRINTELENERNALLYDHDTIRLHARNLGLGGEDEKFARIVGLGQAPKNPPGPGDVVSAGAPPSAGNTVIRIVSIFAALAVFIAFLIQDLLDMNLGPPED